MNEAEQEYRWLNNRIDFLECQIAEEQRKIAQYQEEYDRLSARMLEIFGVTHGNSD